MRDLSSRSHPPVTRPAHDLGVRLPLLIATAVLLVVGVLAGVVVLGSAADADAPPVEPITVQAPAVPPAAPDAVPGDGQPPAAPAPRDEAGYVAPPPPVDDDDDDLDDDGRDDDGFDDNGDDGPGDDGPGDDDGPDDDD
ncbi:hypothetical protein FB558_6045 [Pseudonocardia kunmingensis]|uniref:Small secreted hydrophilic protein n=1 Tax=Pseudonocardia kunmingensis TaxID=630975 RepID=A0A543D900_9PSEU|nr:hypothetical protein FB558_6045 [Pseudonocardia kunmingensis]